ncbi:MAG: hypothetical protein ACR2QC_07900 [Gammaproteobacteria bacterium]
MKIILAVVGTLALIGHLWVVGNGVAYEAYESIAYVRGYLGYFIATAAAFIAGAVAMFLATPTE